MTTSLVRIQELLPPPYTVAPDGVLTRLLDVIALEIDTFHEDLDRMRQSHWLRFAYRLADVEKLAALVGIERLPWEGLSLFRERLVALVVARLQGALGPRELRRFVYDYLRQAEDVLDCVFVLGLRATPFEKAFQPLPQRPRFVPLQLVENPQRRRTSSALAGRSGLVPYLFRWRERNGGLDEALASFQVSGLLGQRTRVPVLVNITTGDLIGYAGPVPFGQTLVLQARGAGLREARATLDGNDVSERLFSVQGFSLGVAFAREDLDETPLLPRMARGDNDWIFLSVGLYDVRGLNRVFFAIAGVDLYEAVFDQTAFDQALFPSGNLARLAMEWVETEPATFAVRVPRQLVVEPASLASADTRRPFEQVADALRSSIRELRAAGVRALVEFVPFREQQRQSVKVTLPWRIIDPEVGPTGAADLLLGGRFGETRLGGARYE